MRVRMNLVVAFFAGKEFIGAVSDDFVQIHVYGRAVRAPDIDGELPRKFASDDFVTSLKNRIGFIRRKRFDVAVGHGAGFFYFRHGPHYVRQVVKALARYIKVRHCTDGLYAVIGVIGNIHDTQGVFFLSHGNSVI